MSGKLAIEATDVKYFGLLHMPGRIPMQDGKAEWPADQFTFRLIQDGAIREQTAAAASAPVAAAAEPDAAAAESNPLTHLRELVSEADHEIARLEQGAPPAPSVTE